MFNFGKLFESSREKGPSRKYILMAIMILASSAYVEAQNGIPAAESVKKANEAREAATKKNDGSRYGSDASEVKKVWDADKRRHVIVEVVHGKRAEHAVGQKELESLGRKDPTPQTPPTTLSEEEAAAARKAAYLRAREPISGNLLYIKEDNVSAAQYKLQDESKGSFGQ